VARIPPPRVWARFLDARRGILFSPSEPSQLGGCVALTAGRRGPTGVHEQRPALGRASPPSVSGGVRPRPLCRATTYELLDPPIGWRYTPSVRPPDPECSKRFAFCSCPHPLWKDLSWRRLACRTLLREGNNGGASWKIAPGRFVLSLVKGGTPPEAVEGFRQVEKSPMRGTIAGPMKSSCVSRGVRSISGQWE